MLRCLTKKKVNCSFQSNVFRFKKRFLHIFILAFFFFHFFGLHWMKLRNGILKIMGVCLERRAKKEEKTVLMEKKNFKKGPDGIRTRDLRFYFHEFESRCNRNDPPPLASAPHQHKQKTRTNYRLYILSNTHNIANAIMFVVQIQYQNQSYQNYHWSRA